MNTLSDDIVIQGAREHNLKNISLRIPRNKLVVITGLSGSGKSSLAFDTLYAEGQRRYLETFSAYARNFLGTLKRPNVDQITGLSPVIAIEQKTVSSNPRSTVGTITEIYDFLRLLFARIGQPVSPATGKPMQRFSNHEIKTHILSSYLNQKITLLAPVVRSRKGHYRELLDNFRKKGFLRARIDGKLIDLESNIQLDRYKIHDIELVIDRVEITKQHQDRVFQSVELALKQGNGTLLILTESSNLPNYLSIHWMCTQSGISFDAPSPNLFSYNSPYGYCPDCLGLGVKYQWNLSKIFNDPSKSLENGACCVYNKRNDIPKPLQKEIDSVLKKFGYTWLSPQSEYSDTFKKYLLFGASEHKGNGFKGLTHFWEDATGAEAEEDSIWMQLKDPSTCTTCKGTRLKAEALLYFVNGANISDLSRMDFEELSKWIQKTPQQLNAVQQNISFELFKELNQRVGFLLNVGLDYLQLQLSSQTLSGGESQRIRLAAQMGSQLVGVLYILDEPSIGLHARDNQKLIASLKQLRDLGNTVLVVEHDREIMMESDYIIDIGPGAGIHGGKVIGIGSYQALSKSNSLTAQYLNQEIKVSDPILSLKTKERSYLTLTGCTGHNLKNVSVSIPLGVFTVITGLSGSGKSSLINETLYPILAKHCHRSEHPILPYKEVLGIEAIDKVINVDQKPIGRTPRSNPATYTGVFTDIRNVFAALPDSKLKGFTAGRFSFNVKGGRCESCGGAGLNTIEMKFLPDVLVTCSVCRGQRYVKDTLSVRYKGKSIADVLNSTISEALVLFESYPAIRIKLQAICDVGLGYIKLGQPATTLSGGEAQRVKLATELAKRNTGKTMYILDEPSTGLHFEDIRQLLQVLKRFIEGGNTVLVIEHNTDIIKSAEYIIDMGPEGGKRGGQVLYSGFLNKMPPLKNNETYRALR